MFLKGFSCSKGGDSGLESLLFLVRADMDLVLLPSIRLKIAPFLIPVDPFLYLENTGGTDSADK